MFWSTFSFDAIFAAACSHSASHVYYTDLIYLFDSESLKAPLPICADTPTGKVDIVLGDRIAELYVLKIPIGLAVWAILTYI